MSFKRTCCLAALLLLCAYPVHADPIGIGFGSSPFEWAALFGEAVVVALILKRYGFDLVRIFYTWVPVTFGTYLLFSALFFGGMYLGDYIISNTFVSLPGSILTALTIAWLSVLELLVIVCEAWIITVLGKKPFFRKTFPRSCSRRSALLISLVANVCSVLIGILAVIAFQLL